VLRVHGCNRSIYCALHSHSQSKHLAAAAAAFHIHSSNTEQQSLCCVFVASTGNVKLSIHDIFYMLATLVALLMLFTSPCG
jgi:hypothetical protein